MEYEAVIAAIQDGGGFDNVARLIFDNNIHINFTMAPQEKKLKESDFVQLGGTWFYKEPMVVRNNDTYEYDIEMYNYHPFECMQSIIMMKNAKDVDRIDRLSIVDMLSQNSATG